MRAFLDWLTAGRPRWDADPLGDRLARDHAAQDFRRWLKVERRAAASTVNLALASLGALYRQRGLGNPNAAGPGPRASALRHRLAHRREGDRRPAATSSAFDP